MMTSPLHLLLMSVLIAACQSCSKPRSYKYAFDVSVQTGNHHDASTDGSVEIKWLNRGHSSKDYSDWVKLDIQGNDDFEQGDNDIYRVETDYPSNDVVEVCAFLDWGSNWQVHEICFRNIRRCFVFDTFIAPGSEKCSHTWRRY